MANLVERSRLHVEGGDDMHTIRHLLIRHGIDYDSKPWPSWFPSIEAVGDGNGTSGGGKTEILRGVETAVVLSEGRAVGFVLDADDSVQDTWQAMSRPLREAGVAPPPTIPAAGFVGESGEYKARVGVWVMPDNQQEGEQGEGTLERFLETLVQEEGPLLPYAREATRRAKTRHGASYPDGAVRKAVLHAWLAWQQEPGLPYGTAIRARYFQHDSLVAEQFVGWFRRVFEGD